MDNEDKAITFKTFFNFRDSSKYLILTFIICLVFRLLLTYFYKLHLPTGDLASLETFRWLWKYIQFGLFYSLIGFWGLILICLYFLLEKKLYYSFIAIFSGVLIFSLTSVAVIGSFMERGTEPKAAWCNT